MEVIKDTLAERWPLKYTCPHCKSNLIAQLSDLDYDSWKVSGYHFDGSAVCKMMYTVHCPACGANGVIDEDIIPLAERRRLQSEYHERDPWR